MSQSYTVTTGSKRTNQAINDALRAAAGYRVQVDAQPVTAGLPAGVAAVEGDDTGSARPPVPVGHAGNGTGAALPQPVRRSMNDFLRTAHLQSYINRSFTVR